jgi:DNA topoisomerase VI subunit A
MSVNYRDRWTQDSVWYNFQPVLQKYGITVTRKHVKKLIGVVCKALGVTRESLGIFAGARATMYFDGEWSSVSFDAIQELAGNGTDVVIIEKMALVHVLAPYADKYGVALVNTTGYFTEYGKKLMRASHNAGGHVAIITDYDLYGLHIASKVPHVLRIGIDEDAFNVH